MGGQVLIRAGTTITANTQFNLEGVLRCFICRFPAPVRDSEHTPVISMSKQRIICAVEGKIGILARDVAPTLPLPLPCPYPAPALPLPSLLESTQP